MAQGKVKTNTNTFPSAKVTASLPRSWRAAVNERQRILFVCGGERGRWPEKQLWLSFGLLGLGGFAPLSSGGNHLGVFFPAATLLLFFSSPLEAAFFAQAGLVVARSRGLCQEVALLELGGLWRQVPMPDAYVCSCTAQVVSLG